MAANIFASSPAEHESMKNVIEHKFQEFLSNLNEPCKLAEFFNVKPLFHRCDPPSKLVTLNLNGEKEILISLKTLTRIKGSKLAEYFEISLTENDRYVKLCSVCKYFDCCFTMRWRETRIIKIYGT